MARGVPRLALFILTLAGILVTTPAQAKRVALVIGNSAYQHAPELENPKNDATDMAAALKALGVEVVEGMDLDKPAMDRKIRDFSIALSGADAGIFYYAGHGLQVNGSNFLVPIDAELSTVSALEFEMVRLDLVQRIMEGEAKTNILFLDACRNNPLARNLARAMGTRAAGIGRGLAAVESGVGTLISFSTQPGNVALDGEGRNSPFAAALVKHIAVSADTLTDLLVDVRNDVMQVTERKQVPWEHSALTGRFYFKTPPETSATPPKPPEPPTGPSETSGYVERAWGLVQNSEDLAALEAFRRQFGTANPSYDQLAASRIEAAKQSEPKADDAAKAEAARARLAMLRAEEDKTRADAQLDSNRSETGRLLAHARVFQQSNITGGEILRRNAGAEASCEKECRAENDCAGFVYYAKGDTWVGQGQTHPRFSNRIDECVFYSGKIDIVRGNSTVYIMRER